MIPSNKPSNKNLELFLNFSEKYGKAKIKKADGQPFLKNFER